MGIIIVSFLIAATATAFFFLIKNNDKQLANGAFLLKYQSLISSLADKRNTEITRVKTSSVSLKITLNKDYHGFTLSEVDNRLIVVWKLHSQTFGKRGQEWSFNPEYSQSKMYGEILGDIRNYQEVLKNEKPMRDQELSLV